MDIIWISGVWRERFHVSGKHAQTKSIEAVFMLRRTMPFASSSLSLLQEVLRVKVGNKLRRRRTLHRHLIVRAKNGRGQRGSSWLKPNDSVYPICSNSAKIALVTYLA